jgi:hypothetical protein
MALIVILLLFVVLDVAALAAGADSRPTISDRPARSI